MVHAHEAHQGRPITDNPAGFGQTRWRRPIALAHGSLHAPVIGGIARSVFAPGRSRFTIIGEDNISVRGRAVMAINHLSYFDFTCAGLAARVRFMARFEHPVAGWLDARDEASPSTSQRASSHRDALTALCRL